MSYHLDPIPATIKLLINLLSDYFNIFCISRSVSMKTANEIGKSNSINPKIYNLVKDIRLNNEIIMQF
jgi:hypothetical protein